MEEQLYPLLGINRLRMGTDGEGVTTLVAGAGCPLTCKYCINRAVLTASPEWVTADTLYSRVRIDDLYFRATGGGITFGGGESLLHTDFLKAFRSLCGTDWRLYAETSLAVSPEKVLAAADAVDAFIVDIKSTEPGIYSQYTGADHSALVLENLQILLQRKGAQNVRVRVPLIPGFNTPEHQRRSEQLLRSMGAERIELFPYRLPKDIPTT